MARELAKGGCAFILAWGFALILNLALLAGGIWVSVKVLQMMEVL